MRIAAIAVVYPNVDTFENHVKTVEDMLSATRDYPGCLDIYMGVNRDLKEIAIFHFWETMEHLDQYLVWRAERGDFDTHSATMRREQEFKTFVVP